MESATTQREMELEMNLKCLQSEETNGSEETVCQLLAPHSELKAKLKIGSAQQRTTLTTLRSKFDSPRSQRLKRGSWSSGSTRIQFKAGY